MSINAVDHYLQNMLKGENFFLNTHTHTLEKYKNKWRSLKKDNT